MNNSLYLNGHHHHDIIALTAHTTHHNNQFVGANQRRWRYIQCGMWTILSVVFVVHVVTERLYYSNPSTENPRNGPHNSVGFSITKRTTSTAEEVKKQNYYHPDLSFTLSSEQSEQRLESISSSHRRKKNSNLIDLNVLTNKEGQEIKSKFQEDEYNGNVSTDRSNVDDDDGDENENGDDQDRDDDYEDASIRENDDRSYSDEIVDSDDNESDEDDTYNRNAGIKHIETSKNEVAVIDSNDSDHSLPLCSRSQVIDGKWIHEVLDEPPYITPTVHLRCYPHDTYYKGAYKTWKWYPNAKKLKKCQMNSFFNKKQFCRLMPDSVVSIVGDSLSWEHYSSLVQLNGIKTKQGYQHQSRELHMNIYQSVCKGRTKVLYRRDDKLQNLTSSIEQDFPVVLVLNRGAHYVPDDDLLADIRKNIAELKDVWIPKCINLKIKCHLFWRTSVPGHPGCSVKVKKSVSKTGLGNAYTEPATDIRKMEALIGDLSEYDERTINYHWYDYQHQNELVVKEFQNAFKDIIKNSPYIDFEIIDAYYLNVLRPDEHRAHQEDCLHNCYPGKMDLYSNLMLHYLMKQRSDDDILQLQDVVSKKKLWFVNESTPFEPDATEIARQIREGGKRKTGT